MSTDRQTPGTVTRADTPLQIVLHAGFALCALAMIVLYAPSYLGLAEIWADTGTFQYAFLIFPICLFLIWSRRTWLARVVARPRPLGLAALGGLLLLWLLGVATQINLAQHIALVLVWPALVYTFYGPRVTGIIAFALAYLVFAIPFGEFLVGPLQTVTAHLSVLALKLTGVPVIMDGHYIDTPASSWHVAEACSGIKFFIALTAFGVLYAHLFFTGMKRRIVFVVIGMIVPIIANGLRVYFTILIGEYIGMHYATGADHMIFGWQFFGLVLFLLFLGGWPWHQAPAEPPAAEQGIAAAPRTRALAVGGAAFAIIVLPALWFAVTGLLAEHRVAAMSVPELPARVAGLEKLNVAGDSDQPLRGASSQRTARYGNPADPLRIDYLAADANTDITSLSDRLFDPRQWQVTGRSRVAARDNGPAFAVERLRDRQTGAHRLLLYAYRIGDHWSASASGVKRQQAIARLTGRAGPAGLLVITGQNPDGAARAARAGAAAAASIVQPSR